MSGNTRGVQVITRLLGAVTAAVTSFSLVTPAIAGPEATTAPGYPAPRLDFTAEERALAGVVAANPGVARFYGENGRQMIWSGSAEATARQEALFDALSKAGAHGVPVSRYDVARLKRAVAETRTSADRLRLETVLSQVFAAYVQDVSTGILNPGAVDSGIKRAVPRKNVANVLSDFAAAPDPGQTLAALVPTDSRYLALEDAMRRMTDGGMPADLPEVPAGTWRIGMQGPAVAALRARLVALGLAADVPEPDVFDQGLALAVMAYQKKAGLPEDGVAGPKTVNRLNGKAGAGPHLNAILVAMERMRWMNGLDLGERYVWVNLTEYNARIIENGQEVFKTRTVVGSTDDDRRTPEFSDMMEYVVVNPRWNVPRSITIKEYLPRLQANRNAVSQLDVVDSRGRVIPRSQIDFGRYTASNFPYRMRQKPSDDNALGIVKFIFPNPWNIYLHDTPTKSLFGNNVRAYSHGCIRVADPRDLAAVLLSKQTPNPEAMFNKALATGRETYLHLEPEVPVHLVYFTAFPNDAGQIQYFSDIYGRDARIYAALQAAAKPLPVIRQLDGVETADATD
ncbi:L,D-transpeptidase family protein [Paracoccus pacificus]|uniref:Murein L,D-transpeptidase n=1 Tax=Paracoccus pacificus TaxID=1463598 RepID=A0ABW4R879_9RHOB